MIDREKRVRAAVDRGMDLYFDLGLDSVSYINLILKVEERFSVTIGIAEMDECLNVGRLISVVESKVRSGR